MDKIQKIRKEVERIQLYSQSETLSQVLDYIDKVQEESVNDGLEEAAIQYGNDSFPSLCSGCKHVPVDAFRAGAKWQKGKDKEEWLDKALDFFGSNYNSLIDGGVIGVFDDKKKMIEEFVEFMNDENL